MVDVKKLRTFYVSASPYFAEIEPCSRNGLWKLSRGLRACFRSRGRGFDSPSCSWKIATFKYESSGRSTLSQVVREVIFRSAGAAFEREVHFRSSGWKIATFKYESCT